MLPLSLCFFRRLLKEPGLPLVPVVHLLHHRYPKGTRRAHKAFLVHKVHKSAFLKASVIDGTRGRGYEEGGL
ncbi:hypothetical protein CSW29_10605 [Thermus scotoductus]|uniref:Uncharacterized protein n=1 Tax=Thermus scotoductus TaxID=37636 RepID=A0A430UEV1_THESC|nr:hypothetical protein CSW29_10605 [Thermus scotoductus]